MRVRNISNIELRGISSKDRNRTLLSEEELYVIKKNEERLKEIKREIERNTQLLDTMVYDSLRKSENNDFVISALDF